jgi:hypothetical protein
MEIGFKRRQLIVWLILGLVWLAWFVAVLLIRNEVDWTNYGYIILSAGYLTIYFYHKQFKYVTIKDGVLQMNGPLGRKIHLSEIVQIKKFAGDYILKSTSKELTINTQAIDPKNLEHLHAALEKLKVEWT